MADDDAQVAEVVGHTVSTDKEKSIEVEVDDGTRAVFANDPDAERHEWAYFGGGPLVAAVHEAMTYAVRDRGFDGTFAEDCGMDYCPFCSGRPFPTDEGRS